jgi:hypothetical protein
MRDELDPPYQRRHERRLNLQFAGAFYVAHAGECAQSGDDSIQVCNILRLDDKLDNRFAVFAGA